MKNIDRLNQELTTIFNGIKNGTMDVQAAATMINAADKIISIQKVKIAYAKALKIEPKIKFLDID